VTVARGREVKSYPIKVFVKIVLYSLALVGLACISSMLPERFHFQLDSPSARKPPARGLFHCNLR